MGKKYERWLEGEERRQAVLADLAGNFAPAGKLYNLWVTSWPEGLDRTSFSMYPPVTVPAGSYIKPMADLEVAFRSVEATLPSMQDLASTGQKAKANWTKYWVVLVAESHDGWVGVAKQKYVMQGSRLRERWGCTGQEWVNPFSSGFNAMDLDPEFAQEYPAGTYAWDQIYAWAVKHADEYQGKYVYKVPAGGATIRYTLYFAPFFGEYQGEPTLPLALYPNGDYFELASATLLVATTNPRPQQNIAPILSQQYGLDVPDPYGTLATTRSAHPEITPANNPWDVAPPQAPGPIVPVYDNMGVDVVMAEWETRGAHRYWVGGTRSDLLDVGNVWDVTPVSDTPSATTPTPDCGQPPAMVVPNSSGDSVVPAVTGMPGAGGMPSWVKWAAIGLGVALVLGVVVVLAVKARKGG